MYELHEIHNNHINNRRAAERIIPSPFHSMLMEFEHLDTQLTWFVENISLNGVLIQGFHKIDSFNKGDFLKEALIVLKPNNYNLSFNPLNLKIERMRLFPINNEKVEYQLGCSFQNLDSINQTALYKYIQQMIINVD